LDQLVGQVAPIGYAVRVLMIIAAMKALLIAGRLDLENTNAFDRRR
jgi:hypothetical protein